MKLDEKQLLVAVYQRRPRPQQGCPAMAELGAELGIHEKRVEYILGKWSSKGWWNYGVSLRTGWLEESGINAALQVIADNLHEAMNDAVE